MPKGDNSVRWSTDPDLIRIRFERRIERTEGCWYWTGAQDRGGYGMFKHHNRQVRAHRFAWELAHGTDPGELLICHHCDEPSCVNPDHLYAGTATDNNRDKSLRFHSKNQWNKISPVMAKEIRARYFWGNSPTVRTQRPGGISQKQLADEYGVVQGRIWSIIRPRHGGGDAHV